MPNTIPSPREIAAALETRVVGQPEAIREMSVALAKKLAGLDAGNVLLIGASGTGKTTLMRAVEKALPDWTGGEPPTLVRIHAKLLAAEADEGRPGQAVLERLLLRARELAAPGAAADELVERLARGVVFVDEVDKIRATIGGEAHAAGLRAQEALLTLIENEAVAFELPGWAGGGAATVDASGILFVCAGAFEGLYDAVYDRVTIGSDRGQLQSVTVVEGGEMREELQFRLRDWLTTADLFDYGISPQFLSRFDAVVLLEDLGPEALARIFLESQDSTLTRSRAYFWSRGLELEISDEAVRRIAVAAAREPRLGARALAGVFRRVIGPYEFEPEARSDGGKIRIGPSQVEEALARGARRPAPGGETASGRS